MFQWLDYLRVCLICSRYDSPIDIMCSECWQYFTELSRAKKNIVSENYSFCVMRLWVWNALSDPYIKPVIYNLKKGHSHQLYLKLAQIFISQINFSYYKNQNIIFIPAPARNASKNHALCFARGLSEVTGRPCFDILVAPQHQSKQKRLSRSEREKRRMKLKLKLKKGRKSRFIFVDDVMTTGATAKAAHRALGRPLNFEVWVLAEKTKRYLDPYE